MSTTATTQPNHRPNHRPTRRIVRLLAGTALVLAPLTPLALPAVSSAAASQSCDGKTATIVGANNTVVSGTEGADVIVTNGARAVMALGGDDRICVTGSYFNAEINAGPGDDRVLGNKSDVTARLGTGEDYFRTERGATVFGNGDPVDVDGATVSCCLDSEADDISVPGPYADVYVGDGGPLADTVHVGGGGFGSATSPRLNVHASSMTKDAVLDGGGSAMLVLDPDTDEGSWTFDNSLGTLSTGGAQRMNFKGINVLDWRTLANLTYRGSSKPELLVAPHAVDVAMRGGDDHVLVSRFEGTQKRRIDGGRGTDTAYAVSDDDTLVLNLRGHLLSFDSAAAPVAVANVETWTAEVNGSASVTGTGSPEKFGVSGCQVRIDAHGGNDVIKDPNDLFGLVDSYYDFSSDPYFPFATVADCSADSPSLYRVLGQGGNDRINLPNFDEALTVFGGTGNDKITTGFGDDEIRGGTGDDVIYSADGDDRVDGRGGNDKISGGDGDDVLYGRSGRNLVDGQAGIDTCGGSGKVTRCGR